MKFTIKKKLVLFAWLLSLPLLSAFMLLACNNNDELDIATYEKSQYNAGFSYTSSKPLAYEDVATEERDLVLENSEDYEVSYKKVKATYSYEDLCAMGADNDILYPGAIVDITDDNYRPLYLDRAPLTISVNLESMIGSSGKLYSDIADPNLSSVRTGIREIVADNVGVESGNLPAKISMDIREVSNEREFYMNVGFGLQVGKLGIAENFSYGNVKHQTNMVIVLKQEYYTVDVDYKGARGLFAQSLTNADINRQLKGKIPAYVASVSYGRIAFITIQTNYSQSEIRNALSVAWGKMNQADFFSTKVDTSLTDIAKDSDTVINYYVYGGGTGVDGAMGQITANSADTISNLFASFNAADSVGLPISYKLRDFSGSLVDVHSSDEYTVKDIKYVPKKIMDWSYLNNLLQSGVMFTEPKIKIDLSAMVDYTNPSETNNTAKRTITIPSNVTEFFLIGPNNATNSIVYKELSLRVSFRKNDNPLKIVLSNISFSADPNPGEGNGVAILSTSDSRINLEINEDVYIEGVKNAIECNNLVIGGAGILTVKGGNGVLTAENNGNGENGYVGIKAQILEVNMEGRLNISGGNGSIGHACKKGGDGGCAVSCDKLNVCTDNITLVSGNGGDGGDGNNGSDGWTGWGSHSDATVGGNGGKGGNALFPLEEKTIVEYNGHKINVRIGIAGNGGRGGNGGNGGIVNNNGKWIVTNGYQLGNPGVGGNGGNGGDVIIIDYDREWIVLEKNANESAGNGGGRGEGGAACRIDGWAGTAGNPAYGAQPARSGNPGDKGTVIVMRTTVE